MGRILILQGHPDRASRHLGHALADAYAEGAATAGHEMRRIAIAELEIPFLHTQEEWKSGIVPQSLLAAQTDLAWADHVVLIFPLWLGTMPAVVKAFFEQVLRPGFAFEIKASGRWGKGLKGKSAHVIVTMGMPAFWYRWVFRAHGVRGLENSILAFCGFSPIRETLLGLVEGASETKRKRWLERMRKFGRAAA